MSDAIHDIENVKEGGREREREREREVGGGGGGGAIGWEINNCGKHPQQQHLLSRNRLSREWVTIVYRLCYMLYV